MLLSLGVKGARAPKSWFVGYVIADINCCLKVVLRSGRSKFFSDDDSLNEAIEHKRIQ